MELFKLPLAESVAKPPPRAPSGSKKPEESAQAPFSNALDRAQQALGRDDHLQANDSAEHSFSRTSQLHEQAEEREVVKHPEADEQGLKPAQEQAALVVAALAVQSMDDPQPIVSGHQEGADGEGLGAAVVDDTQVHLSEPDPEGHPHLPGSVKKEDQPLPPPADPANGNGHPGVGKPSAGGPLPPQPDDATGRPGNGPLPPIPVAGDDAGNEQSEPGKLRAQARRRQNEVAGPFAPGFGGHVSPADNQGPPGKVSMAGLTPVQQQVQGGKSVHKSSRMEDEAGIHASQDGRPALDTLLVADGAVGPPAADTTRVNLFEQARTAEAHQPEMIEQVKRSIETARKAGQSTLRMQLHPEHLGRIDLRLTRGADGLQVSMMADLPGTGALLERSLADLRQTLAQAGINLSDLTIGYGNSQHQPSGMGYRHTSHRSPFQADPASEKQVKSLDEILGWRQIGSLTAVDYRV